MADGVPAPPAPDYEPTPQDERSLAVERAPLTDAEISALKEQLKAEHRERMLQMCV